MFIQLKHPQEKKNNVKIELVNPRWLIRGPAVPQNSDNLDNISCYYKWQRITSTPYLNSPLGFIAGVDQCPIWDLFLNTPEKVCVEFCWRLYSWKCGSPQPSHRQAIVYPNTQTKKWGWQKLNRFFHSGKLPPWSWGIKQDHLTPAPDIDPDPRSATERPHPRTHFGISRLQPGIHGGTRSSQHWPTRTGSAKNSSMKKSESDFDSEGLVSKN